MTQNNDIDVLAILKDAIEREEDAGGIYFVESLRDARAAVSAQLAELATLRAQRDALRDALKELLPMAQEGIKHRPIGWGQLAIDAAEEAIGSAE